MPADQSTPLVNRATDIEYETVEPADGMKKGVLLDESDGTPHIALRRFRIEAGGSVPEHTNEIEHEQYVLEGEYIVGIDDTEYTVAAGDAIHIPAGEVHWYRNESEQPVAFLCAVPTGDDEISLVE